MQAEVNRILFQLTPSRRATNQVTFVAVFSSISTHALTEGDDGAAPGCPERIISTHALTEGDRTSRRSTSTTCTFQLTPSRRATAEFAWKERKEIFQLTPSRRATANLDKFFLLNRGYAYSISLYFLPHFISLLPQILSFQQKSFKFQVRIFLLFSVHLAFALQNQCVHHVKSRFCTNMFYFVFVLFTQIVKPQTIGLFIYDFF